MCFADGRGSGRTGFEEFLMVIFYSVVLYFLVVEGGGGRLVFSDLPVLSLGRNDTSNATSERAVL